MSLSYAILTAAKNEEKYIGLQLQSVLAQTLLPTVWVIVDDGSDDATPQIVERYAAQHSFIRLICAGTTGARSFGSKDRALNAGLAMLESVAFDCICILDADITLPKVDTFETMLAACVGRPRLGIIGGWIYERSNGDWKARLGNSLDSSPGGAQFFRRQCLHDIGGFSPLELGGEDWLAQIEARIRGWEVLVLSGIPVYHHRTSSSAGGRLKGLFRQGKMDASFGSLFAFEVAKCIRRWNDKPLLLGALLRLSGYCWWRLRGRAPVISEQAAHFLREEQLRRLRNVL